MFLEAGGAAQQRYEDLRSRWCVSEGKVLDLVRMPWAHRMFHFGVMGLLDDDASGGNWFGPSRVIPFAGAPESNFRCIRVLLAEDGGDARAREAYRLLLCPTISEPVISVTQVGGVQV